jgi:hypothetical protein
MEKRYEVYCTNNKGGFLIITNKPKLSLPSKLSVPSESIGDYTFLIYGERKIGKTTLASQFPEAFFMFTEPGGKALKIRQVQIDTWETYLKYIDLIESQPDYCQTIVIDTGYNLYEKCFEYCLKELKIEDPRDESWGTGWKFIDREFRRGHEKLFNLPVGVIILAHSEVKEIKTAGGFSHTKIVTQLGGQAYRFYSGVIDVIAYYHYDTDGNRKLCLKGSADVDAGSRIQDHFLGVDNIPMGKSPKEGYNNLINAFNNIKINSNINSNNLKGGDGKTKFVFKKK